MQKAEFVLNPSRKLLYCIHTIYVLAFLVVVGILSVSILWKIIIILSSIWFWTKDCLHYKGRLYANIVRFWHEEDKIFGIETHDGTCIKGILKGDTFKCPWFIILRLKLSNRIAYAQRKKRKHLKNNLKNASYSVKNNSMQLNYAPCTITIFIAKDSLSEFEYRVLCSRLLSF